MTDCERQWAEFLEVAVDHKDRSRYMRINPDIKRPPPSLDDKGEVNKLQADVIRALTMNHRARLQIEEVVFRLVASSFYFDKGKATRSRSGGTATVTGKALNEVEYISAMLTLNRNIAVSVREIVGVAQTTGALFRKATANRLPAIL